MKPEISIIVPIYNTENYLKRCIDSILNQSFTDFELILVNDGSIDNSGIIIDEYKSKDKRIKVIHKENGGQGSARNMGLDIAKGNYIGFVDSDDWIHRDMYKYMHKYIKNMNVDIVQVGHNIVKEYEEDVRYNLDKIKVKVINDIIYNFADCNWFEILPFIFPVNKLYKKKIWKHIRFPEGKFAEDLRVIYRIYSNVYSINVINFKFYNYYMSPNSSTRSPFNIKKLEDVEAWEEVLYFYKENYPNIKTTNLSAIYCRRLRTYYFSINDNPKFKFEQNELYKKFRKNFISCIKTKKLNWREKSVDILFFISPKLCKYIFYRKK